MKPILFNTEMVRAILDGRKTVTRRVVKPQPVMGGFFETYFDWRGVKAPYRPGYIMYVREAWSNVNTKDHPSYFYKADNNRPRDFDGLTPWRPSIHMPHEAARIFLRVTDVRVERLQDITGEDAEKEGCNDYTSTACGFADVWDSTIKPADRALYGWEANPWVWVIEFERCEKPTEGQT